MAVWGDGPGPTRRVAVSLGETGPVRSFRWFGEVRQNGYVVRDLDAALRHWVDVLGVGPWYVFEHVPVTDYEYRGVPYEIDMTIALAQAGALQIELIVQHDDTPSLYRDFLAAGHEGLQHLGFWPDDMDAALEHARSLGLEVGHRGRVGPEGRFVYFLPEGHPGTVLELAEVTGARRDWFARLAEASRRWDGVTGAVTRR